MSDPHGQMAVKFERQTMDFYPATEGQSMEPEEGLEVTMQLEARPYRPFKSSEEYLYAMKEDLAEWLNALYGTRINADNFMEELDTGVILCEHANNFSRHAERKSRQQWAAARDAQPLSLTRHCSPPPEITYNRTAVAGSFFARDNVHNFIDWCRRRGVLDCLLFETEDLVSRKNERHVLLCLLEVARRGAALGLPVPVLVQFELQIDRELARDTAQQQQQQRQGEEGAGQATSAVGLTTDSAQDSPAPVLMYEPTVQVVTNDLKSLDEMVRELVERCTCPSQFPMIRVSDGKYRIGDTKTLIFVRVLRNHVMVRVGGGWDTLHHFLDKHDPCRCKSGHRSPLASKLTMKATNGSGDTDVLGSVEYERVDGCLERPSSLQIQKSQHPRETSSPTTSTTSTSTTSSSNNNNGTSSSLANTKPSPKYSMVTPTYRRHQSVGAPSSTGSSRASRENLPPYASLNTTTSSMAVCTTSVATDSLSTPRAPANGCYTLSPGRDPTKTLTVSQPVTCYPPLGTAERPLSGGSVRFNRTAAFRSSTACPATGPATSAGGRHGTWSCGERRRRDRPTLSAETFLAPSTSPGQQRRRQRSRQSRQFGMNLAATNCCADPALLQHMDHLLRQFNLLPSDSAPISSSAAQQHYVFSPRRDPSCPGAIRTKIPAPVMGGSKDLSQESFH